MSYGIAAYAVGVDRLRETFDGGDGYALERLCRRDGVVLDNNAFSPVSGWSYLETVDAALASAGLLTRSFSLEGLVSNGSPVPLTGDDAEFPVVGHLVHAELAVPAGLLATAPATSLPEEFGDQAYTLFQWLSQAESKGLDLVTFYY